MMRYGEHLQVDFICGRWYNKIASGRDELNSRHCFCVFTPVYASEPEQTNENKELNLIGFA